MTLIRLWNYIRGYVIIIVEGYFLEKFINICIKKQIYLWDIRRKENNRMQLKISIKGFKLLRSAASKTKCRVRILKKCGLPFLLNRYRRRKTFVAGAVVFVIIVYLMSSFIWVVDLKGNEKIKSEELLSQLAALGLKPGVIKYYVNTKRIINDIMINNSGLAWAGISIRGTKARVEIVERVKPPSLVPSDKPCDIVALKDGVIKSIVTKVGLEKVREGDTVTAGQVLITGILPIKNEKNKNKTVHSIGVVKARTWYEGKSQVQVTKLEKQRTGKIASNYSFILFSKRIDFFPRKVAFMDFEKLEILKKLSFGDNLVFPFGIVIDRYYENNTEKKEISIEEARKEAADKAYRDTLALIPKDAEILNRSLKFVQENSDENNVQADVVIECLEEIGIPQEIK